MNVDRLKMLLQYDPKSGLFTRIVKTSNRVKVGDQVGCKNGPGYLVAQLDGKLYLNHRLAWLYMTGDWPLGEIDHIDGRRANNQWANLRDLSHSENMQNLRSPMKGNSAGLLGVTRRHQKFRAAIKANKKALFLGSYQTAEEAHAAYVSAKRQLHPAGTL